MEGYELINFIDLSIKDKNLILEWRNSESVKKWMYNNDQIKKEEHLSFIDSLNNDDTKVYFLLKNSKEYLGVIDFTKISKDSCYYGFYSNPNCKVIGIGRILEKMSLHYAFDILKVKKLKLEVYKDNVQVKNLHKKNGFKIMSEKFVNGQNVLCMELDYENR